MMEIESVINPLPQRESLEPDGFTAEFYQKFQELALIFHKLFQTIERQSFQTLFYEANISLISKPDTDTTV